MRVPRHILHVIDALDHGGAQHLLVLLAEGASAGGYRMSVCVLQPYLGLREKLASKGVTVLGFQRERPSVFRPFAFLRYVHRNIHDLVIFCRTQAVDVVQCHLSDAELLGILAGRLANVECIFTTVHLPILLPERQAGDLRNAFRRIWTRFIYRTWTDCVVAVSQETADSLTGDFGIEPKRVQVIINGVDVGRFAAPAGSSTVLRSSLGIAEGDRVLINVARLTAQKGQSFLLDALASLEHRFPGLCLLLVGEGELRRELEGQSVRLGLGSRVRFLGPRSDVAELLAMSDVFVFPSLFEGTSLALMEALAAGKPVVATNVPGNDVIVRHGENGYLVAPGDSTALAEGIARVLSDPEGARSLGEQGRRRACEEFDVTLTLAKYEALWGNCFGR